MEHSARVLAEGEHHPFPPGDRRGLAGLDQHRCLYLVAAKSGELQSSEHDGRGAGRIRDRVGLVEQRRRGFQIAAEDAHRREIVQGQREHRERAGVAGDLHVAGGQRIPGIVIEQLRRDAAGRPRPAHVLPGTPALVTDRSQCPLERRRAGRITGGETHGQAFEQQIDGTRHPWWGRRLASGLGGGPRAAAEPAGDARGAQRFQVGLARKGGVERLELSGRISEQRHRVPAAPQVQGDLPVQALEHGPVEVA